ncbi:hypothetical protein [Nitrosomonas sp.]|uniref:hypothetical protein n=1 Tax=Nitrosomonas sp. TaxID=42353 RepID=UPI00271D684E|nr:hypothetical protein [Nitrosomonas sp.]MDO8895759.1 hypothetical protein [Nitrosomonas sp.]
MNLLTCVDYSGDKHTGAKIKENDPAAKLKTVNISAPNGDWFVFYPDKGRGKPPIMSPLLAVGGNHQHHRACDAVIVVLKEAKLKLIFIELKSASPSCYTGQFQSTRQFTRYLLGLLNEFQGISFKIEERFILFHTPKMQKILLDKTPTYWRNTKSFSTDPKNPQKEVVQDGITIFLKQLLI